MQLSFQFEDFFRHRHQPHSDRSDVETPTFLVQDGVVGDVKVKNLMENLLNDHDARIEVILEGYMRTELDTCVDRHSEFRVTVEKKILSMTQALSIQGHATGASHNEKRYPFNFNIASWLRFDQQNSHHHRAMASRSNFASLPPSLKHEVTGTPQNGSKPRAGARVSYVVTARLLKGHRTIQRIVQPILLLLTHAPTPPLCITDFNGEYRPAQKSVLRGPFFQKAGQLSVIVREPKPLNVKAKCAECMVELPVKLRLERPTQEASAMEHLFVEAEIKWQFCFSTFVSMLEQRGPATMKQAIASPATACVRSALKPRTLRMVWRKWYQRECTDALTVVESEQFLWLALPRSEVLTPTFWSSFLSRRYSIWLQVKVTKPGTAKLEVEVPIQVGIEAALPDDFGTEPQQDVRRNGESIFADAEGDELLPQYAR